jgi:uncharacterized paraquat-inducible protein A
MQVRTLAAGLLPVAGGLVGFALAIPTLLTIANAVLFSAWTFAALRLAHLQSHGRSCAACGAIEPMQLPDGSCERCAAPARKARLSA